MFETNSEQTDCLREGASTLNWNGVGDGLNEEGTTSSANGHVGEGASIAILNCTGILCERNKKTLIRDNNDAATATATATQAAVAIETMWFHSHEN